MATSGSWSYSRTAAQIIQSSYENLGVIIPGAQVSVARSTKAMTELNLLVKQYQGNSDGAPGVKIHTRQRITMLLAKGQQAYTIGPASTDSRASALVGRTTLDAAEAIGQTTLSVTDTSDTTTYPGTTLTMAASDIIGIQQDDGTIFWTTVVSISAGVSVTVTTGLEVAASSGNYVWWFTSRAQRFPVIESALLRQSGMTDSTLDVYTVAAQYDQGVSNKYADGSPTSVLVEPLRLNTRLTFNSQPTDVTQMVVLTVLYPAEDYVSVSDDIAFPQEAFRFLSWELAFSLSPIYRWTPQMDKLRNEARAMYLNLNPENSVAYFQVGGL